MANKLAVKFDNSNNQMLAGDMNEEILSDSDVDSRWLKKKKKISTF